jgi:hypothetical protein
MAQQSIGCPCIRCSPQTGLRARRALTSDHAEVESGGLATSDLKPSIRNPACTVRLWADELLIIALYLKTGIKPEHKELILEWIKKRGIKPKISEAKMKKR